MCAQRSRPDTAAESADDHPGHSSWRRRAQRLAIGLFFLSVIAVEPALAQTDPICDAAKLPEMIEGFFQLTTAIGGIGLVVMWQADILIEMFTLSPEQKSSLKRHRRSAMKSGVLLLVLGPLYSVAGTMMGLPLAECVSLAPW